MLSARPAPRNEHVDAARRLRQEDRRLAAELPPPMTITSSPPHNWASTNVAP